MADQQLSFSLLVNLIQHTESQKSRQSPFSVRVCDKTETNSWKETKQNCEYKQQWRQPPVTFDMFSTCKSPNVSSWKSAKTITINPYTRLLQVFDTGWEQNEITNWELFIYNDKHNITDFTVQISRFASILICNFLPCLYHLIYYFKLWWP